MSASQTNHCAEVYNRQRDASPKRKPRTPSPTNERKAERQPERQPERQRRSVSIHGRVSLGKVSGVTIGKGRCNDDRDRIIIDGKLLVVKFANPTPTNPNYAPATKYALDLKSDECAYVGMDGIRRVFMRHGELFGGEKKCGYYDLEEIKEEEPKQERKLWKVMHHPEWGFNPHPEAPEFFELGEYWVCTGHSSTPKSTVDGIKIGHRFVLRPNTVIGKKGQKLKSMRPCDEDIYRFGTVRTKAMNVGGELGRKGWMKFKVDWEESIPYNGKYTNKAQKTITLQ